MKRIAYSLLVVIIVITIAALPVSAQSVESRQVSGFNGIVTGGPFTIHVKIDGTESLKISTKPDIVKLIETSVQHGILKIKFRDNLGPGEGNTDGPIDIYVTAKSLSSLVKEGSGFVTVDGEFTGNDVSIVLNGSGNIQSSAKAGNIRINITGSGSVRLNGTADKAEIIVNGPGKMDSHDLKVNDATVMITGSGNAYFAAEKSISAHVAGTGNVVYSGNATVTEGSATKVK